MARNSISAILALGLMLWITPAQAGQSEPDLAYSADSWQEAQALLPQSAAVSLTMQYYPGGKVIGVKLLPGSPPVYAVKVKTNGQVLRVMIDAQSGRVLGN